MQHIIIEIKAQLDDVDKVRAYLKENNAEFRGVDQQIDTYYQVPNGRLKLRRGKIENSLIFYDRPNDLGPKRSEVSLFEMDVVGCAKLYQTLTNALELLTVVNKEREIYFIDNVKFHIDSVRELGEYVEIEAIDMDGTHDEKSLREQCNFYMEAFGIDESHLINASYSDLLMEQNA